MKFDLPIQGTDGQKTLLSVTCGETLFVVGANGTGKSSLMQRFSATAGVNTRRISASRQNWLQSSAIEFSPSQKIHYEQQARQWDNQDQSRFMERNAPQRSGITLFDLIDAENSDARLIASAFRAGDLAKAEKLAAQKAPIQKINELFVMSQIPIRISVEGGDRVMASKNGSPLYGAAELSDGERNALLIAADVLTSKPATILIIDEPERHLHRSIISPLLTQLFRYRRDCAFVVATHDLTLPIDNEDARVLLVRSCIYAGQRAQGWDFDLLPARADIEENLKQDIIGARRKVLFVEGEKSSLDQPIYTLLFPDASVRPKGASRDVEQAVHGVRASESVHWVKAWGIIDHDGRDNEEVTALKASGIFALPFYSVESIYYHPEIIKGVALRHAAVVGGDGLAKADAAIEAALRATGPYFSRLAARAVERKIRRKFFSFLPTQNMIQQRIPISAKIDTAFVLDAEIADLNAAKERRDWVRILTTCPIRETTALNDIARAVGLLDRHQYESAVLQMLREDSVMLNIARSFFGALPSELGVEEPL